MESRGARPFLDHIAADRFAPVCELIAMAGLCRGEAAGPRWSDLNLDDGHLVVRQQIVQLDNQDFDCSCAESNIAVS